MHRSRPLRLLVAAAAAALAASAVAASPASAPAATPGARQTATADHEVALELGDAARVDGEAVGVNPGHLAGTDGTYPCGSDPTALCQTILVTVTNPVAEDAPKGRTRATLTLALDGAGVGDAAVMVYDADAEGTRGAQVASSDELGTMADEGTSVAVTTTVDEPTRYYLVEVFFHAWAGTWGMDLTFA